MKTKFTPIVKFKKNGLDSSELKVQEISLKLQKNEALLSEEYNRLMEMPTPTSGLITEYQFNRLLLQKQRDVVTREKESLDTVKEELQNAKKEYKLAHIEFEKFKYLESEEIKKMIKELQTKEAKELDEVALQSFMNRRINL